MAAEMGDKAIGSTVIPHEKCDFSHGEERACRFTTCGRHNLAPVTVDISDLPDTPESIG